MLPLLTTAQMREADAAAVAARGVDALVAAAGTAVGLEAQRMLGRCYGARVAVLVGPGLNGADGRVAARWLRSRGATVDVVAVADQPTILEGYRLVIDAAFGLGCSRPYVAPAVTLGTAVLAVDLPSGVDADSGEIMGAPMAADVTLALGAFKLAHVTGEAAALAGALRLAGLGIVQHFSDAVMEDADLARLVSGDARDHKWSHAVQVFAGSPEMPGAAALVARGALAGGASMIRLATRGDVTTLSDLPPEVVRVADAALDPRCRAVAAGPGLGPDAGPWLAERLGGVEVPVVLDADGLDRRLFDGRPGWILTPHAGEFARLTGAPVPADRVGAARALARDSGCVVLLKGPTTVLADPAGMLRVVRSGTAALATAGSGDVLTGLIAATIARGHGPLEAGALAAQLHGRAGARLETYAPASEVATNVDAILHRLQRLAGAERPRIGDAGLAG
ncbi:MAG: NAD(P)H-hydrate dehydratase [Acidimicrobiales bacterium]